MGKVENNIKAMALADITKKQLADGEWYICEKTNEP